MTRISLPLILLISFFGIKSAWLNSFNQKHELNSSKKSKIATSKAKSAASSSSPVLFMKPFASGAGDGSDWDNALGESDLKVTAEAGGTLYLAAGTYSTSSQIEIRENLCIIGGFESTITGNDTCSYDPILNQTILDLSLIHI